MASEGRSAPFVFSKKDQKTIAGILERYPPGRQQSAAMPVLYLAQKANGGWLSVPALEAVAALLDMPYIKVYEVASFYTMFYLEPVGRHLVQVCMTTPCWLRGSDTVMTACERHLGIKQGQTTSDGTFTLVGVECLGACVNAPVVQVNDDFVEDLTPDAMIQVLKDLAKKEKV